MNLICTGVGILSEVTRTIADTKLEGKIYPIQEPTFSLNIRGPFIGNSMEDGSVYNNWDNQPESPSQTHDFIKITFHRFLWELRSQNLCSNKNIY